MPSWERLRYFKENQGGSNGPPASGEATDENLQMLDKTAGTAWAALISADPNRQGFLVQNTSQNELSVRIVGSNVSGARLPGYGDSFYPDFKPKQAYEIKASAANSTFVLTVW